jgi:hypothetical protein
MQPLSISKTRTGSWTDGQASMFELYFQKSKHGKRVVVFHWLDKGIVEIRAIQGDGRTPKFRQFERAVIDRPGGDWPAVAAEIARTMADRHFATPAGDNLARTKAEWGW